MRKLGLNEQIMTMCALSYCLGRRTYVVGACTEWLRARWDKLTDNTRHVILRDTIEALIEERAGMDMDVDEWEGLVRWANDRESVEFRERVLEALLWRGSEAQSRELLGLS